MSKRITIVLTVEDKEAERITDDMKKMGASILGAIRVRPAHTTYSIKIEDWPQK